MLLNTNHRIIWNKNLNPVTWFCQQTPVKYITIAKELFIFKPLEVRKPLLLNSLSYLIFKENNICRRTFSNGGISFSLQLHGNKERRRYGSSFCMFVRHILSIISRFVNVYIHSWNSSKWCRNRSMYADMHA